VQCTVAGVEGDRELERCGVKIMVFVERGAVMYGDISNIDMRHIRIRQRQQNDCQAANTYTHTNRKIVNETNILSH
jgi:hypothetical protein